MGSTDDTAITGESSLGIDGHVAFGGRLAVGELLALTTGIDAGRPTVALVDVLARIRLATHAEVLVVVGGERSRSVALPVRAIVRQPNIRLIVDHDPPARSEVLLDAPDWTELDEPFVVSRFSALTFAEFVMQQ